MGGVRFPEEQLKTYLRVFMPEDRIEGVLDEVAQAAVESDVTDEIELYSLTHWLMDADDRRTDDAEAVVLVEEVGLPRRDVAIILDLQVQDVDRAVARAWAELATPSEEPGATILPPADRSIVRDHVEDPVVGPLVDPDPEPKPAAPMPSPPPTGPSFTMRRLGAVLAVAAFVTLGVAVFSSAGQQRLAVQGFSPVFAVLIVVGPIVAGALLLRATGSKPSGADPVPGVSAEDRTGEPADPSA